MLIYATDRPVPVEAFRDVLVRSTLAERRPIDDDECLRGMLDRADLTVTCWDEHRLVGIARSVTDFSYCCYLSDLAVDRAFQQNGIGRELVRRTQDALGPHCRLILLAAPAAIGYYEHLGFDRHDQCWTLPRERSI